MRSAIDVIELASPTCVTHLGRGQKRPLDGIVGNAPRLQEVRDRIERVAPTTATVLITGETGTGKELVAQAVHRRSRRAARPMVSANLAAMPREIVGSELFGHEAGAFTGAIQRRLGRFEAAHQGTLFLDEVGELPPEVQVALLRALQEGEFERLGSSQTRKVDVRVIAATNRRLEASLDEGIFRCDLYYRLAVFPIHLPSLRERRDDIPDLARHFLFGLSDRIGRVFSGIEPASIDRLVAYSWPGNVRELQNVIEHGAILSDGGLLRVPDILLSGRVIAGPCAVGRLTEALEGGERRLIEHALQQSHGRVFGPSGAASRLGVPSSTLESKIKRLRIDKLRYRTSSGSLSGSA